MMRVRIFSSTIILFLFLITLATFQVFILNTHSTRGKELTRITREIEDVEDENGRLSQKIASASSLLTISAKAQRLGFTRYSSFALPSSSQPLAYSLGPSL